MGAWDLYNKVGSIRELMPGQGLLPSAFAVLRVIAKEESGEVLKMLAKGTVKEGTPEAELSHTWIAEDYIARHAGVSLRTVTTALSRLKGRGCIDVSSRPLDDYGHEQSTYKRINRPWLEAMLLALLEDHAWWKAHRYDGRKKKKEKAAQKRNYAAHTVLVTSSAVSVLVEASAIETQKTIISATPSHADTSNIPAQQPPVLASAGAVIEPVVRAMPTAVQARVLAAYLGILRGGPVHDLEGESERLSPILDITDLETAKRVMNFTKNGADGEMWSDIKRENGTFITGIFAYLLTKYLASIENPAA